MQDEPYLCLGFLTGSEIGVQPTLDGQDILVQHSDVGQSLACLLTSGEAEIIRRGGILYWRIPHNHEVDGIHTELTNLFISIHYAHPTLVQPQLELDEPTP